MIVSKSIKSKKILLAWALLAMTCVTMSGCIRSYRAYPCGQVPYDYCPPQALPYTNYSACPTPIAASYFAPYADNECHGESE